MREWIALVGVALTGLGWLIHNSFRLGALIRDVDALKKVNGMNGTSPTWERADLAEKDRERADERWKEIIARLDRIQSKLDNHGGV